MMRYDMVTPDASQLSHTRWRDQVGRAVTPCTLSSLPLMSDRVDGMLSEYTYPPTSNIVRERNALNSRYAMTGRDPCPLPRCSHTTHERTSGALQSNCHTHPECCVTTHAVDTLCAGPHLAGRRAQQ